MSQFCHIGGVFPGLHWSSSPVIGSHRFSDVPLGQCQQEQNLPYSVTDTAAVSIRNRLSLIDTAAVSIRNRLSLIDTGSVNKNRLSLTDVAAVSIASALA